MPTQPDMSFHGLPPLAEATTVHQAAGLWWAGAVLRHHFVDREHHLALTQGHEPTILVTYQNILVEAVRSRGDLEEHLGAFARILGRCSEENRTTLIRVDGQSPDDMLQEAADAAGLPTKVVIFPFCSYTLLAMGQDSHSLIARVGFNGTAAQVWPSAEA